MLKFWKKMFFSQFMLYEDEPGGGGGGTGEPNFLEQLGELGGDPALQNFKDPASLAKSFLEMKKMQGNSIRIPGEDAGEDAIKEFNQKLIEKVPTLMPKPNFDVKEQAEAFYQSLGVPTDENGYEVPEVEGVDPTIIPEERMNVMRKIAKENNFTKKQFEGMIAATLKDQAESIHANASAIAESMSGLKQEWGYAFDDNMKLAVEAAKVTGAPDSLMNAIAANQVGADTIKWLNAIGKQLGSEGNDLSSQGGGDSSQAITPDEARAQISEIMANKQHPYYNSRHPDHAAALQRMVELQSFANPGSSKDINDLRVGGGFNFN